MKRIILCAMAIVLIGGNAFAQLFPSYGPSGSYSSSPVPLAQAPAFGKPAGVEKAYDPYGTIAAGAQFGTSTGVQRIMDPYGTGAAATRFGPPPEAARATR